MKQLNKRQNSIFNFIRENKKAANKDIINYFIKQNIEISRFTVLRDLDYLKNKKLIIKIGNGRNTFYELKDKNILLQYIDVEEYFKKPPDNRNSRISFNFDIYKNLNDLLYKTELDKLNKLNFNYQKRIKLLSPTIIKKEFERLVIEFSWKSSQIEGNTYSLLETEVLLINKKKAKGKKDEEAIMILNHKKAFDFIFEKKSNFQKISLKKIENIHALLTEELGIGKGIRKRLVGIIGTKYRPLDNEYQVKEALEKLVKKINSFNDPFSKAFLAILMISYIQPFEDGNKRTARVLGNAILLAFDICPLSYRNVDDVEYKKAVLLFYEQNYINYFKEIFLDQFQFVVDNYFL